MMDCVLHCAVRRTVAIVEGTGEKLEFRDHWLHLRPDELATQGYLEGPWKGYTYFYRDYEHAHEELKGGNDHENTGMFASFDEEKPVVLNKGQKKALRDYSDSINREDTAMWAELKGVPAYRRASRLLPRGCRSFVLELFAGAAALTAMALGYGLPAASPIDLQAPGWNLRDPAARQRLQARIEEEDPYLLAIAPVTLPWNSWNAYDLWRPGEAADEVRAGRREWYEAFAWLCQLVQQRTAQGRQVVLESSWSGLLWETKCLEQTLGQHNPATEQDLEVVYVDMSRLGLRDMVSGQPVPKESGILTASRHTKQALQQDFREAGGESPARRHRRARLAAKWPDQLCETVLRGVFEDLQELHCGVASAAEEGAEASEELGTLDALHRPEDEIDVPMPPPLQPHELQREEVLEEAAEPQQPEAEKERKRKWLRLERNQRLAIRRLHHMTGHASNESMMRMLRAAGSSPTVVAACRFFRCQVCLEKKNPPQPSSVTSAPPYQFNYEVGCDAFEVVDATGEKHTILSLVDSGTKYHVASRVSGGGVPGSKVCSDMFSASWLAPFGPPKFLVCDQGVHNRGQFAALMASMGTQLRMVGARAPWQLGRTERHGGILKQMMKRIIQQHQVHGGDAVNLVAQQCAAVKNGSYNHSGYCPTQWVLGKLPSEVTSLTEERDVEMLGAQEEHADDTNAFGKRLLLRQWAREAFVYIDGSQRLRRAMLRQAHPMRGPYRTGDLVSYFRKGKWFGPARVLSLEGKASYWLVHGGMTVLVAETALRPATVEEIRRRQALEMRPSWTRQSGKRKHQDLEEEELLPFEEEVPEFDEVGQVPYFNFDGPAPSLTTPALMDAESSEALPPPPGLEGQTAEPSATEGAGEEGMPRQVTQPEQEPQDGTETQPQQDEATMNENPSTSSTSGPSAPQEVPAKTKLSIKEANRKFRAFLAQRGEKKYKKKVAKQGAGRELPYHKVSPEIRAEIDQARRKEWDNWKGYTNMRKISKDEFATMRAANPSLRVIPTRWVDIDKSDDPTQRKLKSRFVVRGDLEDASKMRTDSPTGSQVAMGLTLSFAASTGRPLRSGDISAAFLQGSELDRQLVLSMPKGGTPYDMEDGDLIVVSTTVYGTKDAPRGWYKKLDGTLVQQGLRRVPHAPGFYVLTGHRENGQPYVKGVLLIHVDDLLWSGDQDFQDIMLTVQGIYKFGSLEEKAFRYCGRQLRQDDRGIHVSCPELVGRVRPIALEVARLQMAVSDPTVQDLVDANNLVRYASRTKDQGILYPAGALSFDDMMVLAIQDASYAADYDLSSTGKKLGYRSQSGRMLFLAPGNYMKNMSSVGYLISWHSTVIKRVSKSTLQAETLSLQLGAAEADHLRAVIHGLYCDMGKGEAEQWMVEAQDRTHTAWFTDCFSLWSHLMNPAAGSVADKRLAIDLCALRQELWRGSGQSVGDPLGSDKPPDEASTTVTWTTTDRMLADGLTKKLLYDKSILDVMDGHVITLAPNPDQKRKTSVNTSPCED
ncbi:RE2 [Symbiodinium necroappetens]|uniref:RE2 protein n=1 Tax=Symbiodinium necroappetens TaxID=1628268 RepID=A0A812L1L7_9DINO|nr:RE2 [Symbiodinium necroappetens]